MAAHGFFGAVLVQASSNRIIAGNHRTRVARRLGEQTVPVLFVDVDDDQARRLLLVDNRTNDLAAYDDRELAALLDDLAQTSDLAGTGFGDDDLAALLDRLAPPEPPDGFPDADPDALVIDYRCPSCGYEWSGQPAPGMSSDDPRSDAGARMTVSTTPGRSRRSWGHREASGVVPPPYRVPDMAEIAEMPTNGLTVASTFAGAGGSSTGWQIAGYRVAWACEFHPPAADSYAANHPGTILDRRDVRLVTGAEILDAAGPADVLDGSPPCQDFSMAGKRSRGWGEAREHGDGTHQRSDDLFGQYTLPARRAAPARRSSPRTSRVW